MDKASNYRSYGSFWATPIRQSNSTHQQPQSRHVSFYDSFSPSRSKLNDAILKDQTIDIVRRAGILSDDDALKHVRAQQIANEVLNDETFRKHLLSDDFQEMHATDLGVIASSLPFMKAALDPTRDESYRIIATHNESGEIELGWTPNQFKHSDAKKAHSKTTNRATLLLLKIYLSQEFGSNVADELWQPGSDLFFMHRIGAALTRPKLLEILKQAKLIELESRFIGKRWADNRFPWQSPFLLPFVDTQSERLHRFTKIRYEMTFTSRNKRFVWEKVESPLLKKDKIAAEKIENKISILTFMSYLQQKTDSSICNYIWQHHFQSDFPTGRRRLTYKDIKLIYREAKTIRKMRAFELRQEDADEIFEQCIKAKSSQPTISDCQIQYKRFLNAIGLGKNVFLPKTEDAIENSRALLEDFVKYVAARYGTELARNAWENKLRAFYLVGIRPSSKEFFSILSDLKTRFYSAEMEIKAYADRYLRNTPVIRNDLHLSSKRLQQLKHDFENEALSDLKRTGILPTLDELNDLLIRCHAKLCSNAMRYAAFHEAFAELFPNKQKEKPLSKEEEQQLQELQKSKLDDFYHKYCDALKDGGYKLVWDNRRPYFPIHIRKKSIEETAAALKLRDWIKQTDPAEFIADRKRRDNLRAHSKASHGDKFAAGSEFLFYTSSVSYVTPFVPQLAKYAGALPNFLNHAFITLGFTNFDPNPDTNPFLSDLFAQTREPYLAAAGSALLAAIMEIYNYQEAKNNDRTRENRIQLLATEYRIALNLTTICKYLQTNYNTLKSSRRYRLCSKEELIETLEVLENEMASRYAELTAELGADIDRTNLVLNPSSAVLNGAYAANSALYVMAIEVPIGGAIQDMALLVSTFGYGAVTFLFAALYGYMVYYECQQQKICSEAKARAQYALNALDQKALYQDLSPEEIKLYDPLCFAHQKYRQHKINSAWIIEPILKNPNAPITENMRGDVVKSIYRNQNDANHSFNKNTYVIRTVTSLISSAFAFFLLAAKIGLVATAAVGTATAAAAISLSGMLISIGFGLLLGLIIFLLIVWYRNHTAKQAEDMQNEWLHACRYMEGPKWDALKAEGLDDDLVREFAFRKYLRRNLQLSLVHLAAALQDEYREAAEFEPRYEGDKPQMPVTRLVAEDFRPHTEENLDDQTKHLENLKWRNHIKGLGSLSDISDITKNLKAMLVPA